MGAALITTLQSVRDALLPDENRQRTYTRRRSFVSSQLPGRRCPMTANILLTVLMTRARITIDGSPSQPQNTLHHRQIHRLSGTRQSLLGTITVLIASEQLTAS